MKYFKKILFFLCLIITIINPFIEVYGTSITYKQVTNEGGTNANSKDGVTVSKTISEVNYKTGESNLENYFDITLKVQTRSKAEDLALQVVIVLDISNTMTYKMSKDSKKTRLEAAQEASEKFITEFAARASENTGVDRKIGFVMFNTSAYTVFDLQSCNTKEKAEELVNKINNETNRVVSSENYGSSSPERFTNIEAGLKLANDMLSNSSMSSKHIVFISDGFPTTYVKEDYTGYNPYMNSNTNSFYKEYLKKNNNKINPEDDGIFYDSVKGRPCDLGTSYSDRSAIKAREMATKIKNNGASIYSIGVDIGGQTIKRYVDQIETRGIYVVDRQSENYEIGDASSEDAYKDWLRNKIGSGFYEDADTSEQFKDIFDMIFQKLIELSEASWVADDPMNVSSAVKNIEFVGIYDVDKTLKTSVVMTNGKGNTASYNDTDKINWNLKKSEPQIIQNGNETYYVYELHYRIRLQNEQTSFKEIDENTNNLKKYPTNGTTTLKYNVNTNNKIENKEITFPVPEIIGYLEDLEFTKVSKVNQEITLEGAKFELSHSSECPCYKEHKHIDKLTYESTSDSSGTVKFKNIPSGHKYILKEVTAPNGHILDKNSYNVEISYNNVIHAISGNKLINDYLKSDLNVSKIVEGNINSSGTFKFSLNITYKNKPLTGTFKYTKNNKDGDITLDKDGNATIYLKHNETIYIKGLPYGSEFIIKELSSEGYEVNYKINENDITFGTSLKSKLDSFEKPTTVKFINFGGYIMPETGSSGTLILVITGAILTGGSVINICYMYYKKRN